MIRILQSHRLLTVSGVTERTMFILRVSVLVFLGVSGAFAAGGLQLQQQGSYLQQATNAQASESVPASEVEYVDGPLAPLYDFLIQRRLQKFCKLLRDAGLEEVLQGLGGYWTLFVPTDASFLYLPGGTLDNLKRNPQQLRDFILYHFVTGDFPSSQILNEMMVDSVQGASLRFNIYGQIITVSGAQILEPDLEFELGRVHIIDHPLHPIPTTDTVSFLRTSHQRLYRLLLDVGLIDYLSSGTFTILAPNDDAFDFLSVELKDALSANRSLAERVLLNHILPGSIYTGGIVDGMRWDTVSGSVITFTTKRGLIFANGIPIVLPDIPFTNGVVQVLNRVLLPEGVEADCNCKPSTSPSQQPSPQVPGGSRPSFGQTQRPQIPTRRPNDQYFPRQTTRPFGGQTPAVGNPNSPPMRQPVSPRLPAQQPQQPQRPFSPSRTGPPVRPLPPPVQITRSPLERPFTQPPPEDNSNTVVGPEFQPPGGQRKPEPSRTTRYPPPRRGPNSQTPGISAQPPRETFRGQQPQTISDNDVRFPDQDIAAVVTNPPRQTSRWVNRQQTQAPRYPTRPQSTIRAPATTRRPQTTRSYNRPPPVAGQIPDQNAHSGQTFTSPSPQQEFQTQRPPTGTSSWQQRKQVTIKPAVQSRPPTQPRIPSPPQRRPTQPRPFSTTAPVVPQETDQPFESNRQQPTCRRRGDRVTPSTQNLPLCPETDSQGCQSAPYNPSDPRPLCTASSECRGPNEPFNPSDNRPLCASPVPGEGCRAPGERTYVGDRRQLCSLSRPTQANCKDPSTPFSRSDNRPLCPTTSSINNVTPPQEIPQTGCRRQGEPTNTQDRRPLCPLETQEDCRPFLERPKAGDRRPICNINRQPIQINPSHVNKGQTPQTQQRPTHSQNNRGPNTQTTRRQSWQQTTHAPQPTIAPVTSPNNQVGKVPPVSGSQRPPFEPQRGSRPPISQPQPGTGSQPQTGSYPSRPQSGSYPSQPDSGPNAFQPQSPGTGSSQTGPNAFQPQSPGTGSSHPQTGPNAVQPETNQPQSPTRPPQSQSPGSRQPPQNPTLTRPYQPPPQTVPRPAFVPQAPPSGSGAHSQGPYPQQGTAQPSPPSQSFQTPYPVNQPIDSNVGPGSNQPFTPQIQPVIPPRQQTGSVTAYPGRITSAPRVPVSVTGTSATPGEDSRRTLYEIVEDPSLLIRGSPVKMTKIFSLFHKAGLDDILSGPGPITVFLPADDAFALLPKGVVDQLEENVELLRRVLLYHVTNIEVLPNVQGGSYTVPSQEGTQIPITMLNKGRMILISGAKAIAVTRANNGIFYVINQLLYPLPHGTIVGAIQSRPDLSTLSWLLTQNGLTDMLEGETPYTLLAPTDNAFAQLPPGALEIFTQNATALRELLFNHIVEGAHYGREFLAGGTFPNARGGKLKFQVVSYGYQVNEINIKTPEIVTGTGVIHLIDEVLLEDSDRRLFNALDNSVTGADVTPVDNLQPPANEFLPFDGQPPSSTGQRHGFGQPTPGGQISRRGPTLGQPQITGLQPPSGQTISQRTPQGQPQITGLQPPSGQTISQRTPQGQQAPVTQRPFNRQPQITGHRPTSEQAISQRTPQGQHAPVTQRPSNRQPQNAVTTAFGGQRQPVTQTFGQPTHGNRRPVSGTQTFTGQRQPFQPPNMPVVENGNGQQANVADLARAMGLNRFANWLTNTGLLEKIHDGGVYTVFAPTDDAVNSLPQDMVYSIDSNPDQTKSLLQYHIIPRRLNLNSVSNEETSSTLLQGKSIRFNVYQTVQPNCKQLVTASGTPIGDALATMGSIQIIPVTQVLYQPTGNMLNIIDASPILQSLSQAIKSARITWVLTGSGPLTFFAPSDTAFQSLSPEEKKNLIDDKQAFTEFLKRHLVRGTFFSSGVQEDLEKSSEANTPLTISLQEGILTVNSVPVAYSDITATNGVLHVIDQFL